MAAAEAARATNIKLVRRVDWSGQGASSALLIMISRFPLSRYDLIGRALATSSREGADDKLLGLNCQQKAEVATSGRIQQQRRAATSSTICMFCAGLSRRRGSMVLRVTGPGDQ